MVILSFIVVMVAGYLLGSIPTGYLIAKAKGVDIRTVGSGNMGATNVFRVLGKVPGTIALVVDGLKGFAACTWVCDGLLPLLGVSLLPPSGTELYRLAAGIAAVLGHNYTCWLKFKGGKGIATSAGVFFALAPLAAGISLVAWIVTLALTRYVSVASIVAALALPTAVWFTTNSLILRVVTIALGLLAIVKHKTNIQRLRNGTERRMGQKPPAEETTK